MACSILEPRRREEIEALDRSNTASAAYLKRPTSDMQSTRAARFYSSPMEPKNSMIRSVSSEKAHRSVSLPSFMWAISAVR